MGTYTVHNTFLSRGYRPFIDLGEAAAETAIPVYRVEFDAQDLMNGERSHRFGIQRLMPQSFRKLLIQEAKLPQYDVEDPIHLPPELATQRWLYMTEQLGAFDQLPANRQFLIARLLLSLGFHTVLRSLTPPYGPDAIASDKKIAELALIRAVAGNVLHLDFGVAFDPREYEVVASNATCAFARLAAALGYLVHAAKVERNAAVTRQWAQIAKKLARVICSNDDLLDDFGRHFLTSCVYRATAMAPLLTGDDKAMVEEMDWAEAHARYLLRVAAHDGREKLLARENLETVLQSRVKEALAIQDLDLAEERCREMASYDELDPKNFMELGNVLSRHGKTDDALNAYRRSALLGPPGTPGAWFMMAQCYERLGEVEAAADSYMRTLEVDPLGYSAAERLRDLATELGWSAVATWAHERAVEA